MKAHRTDGVSFAFGLLFLAIAAWWLVAQLFDLDLPAVGWIASGALILIGVLGLLGALRSGRHSTAAPAQTAGTEAPTSGESYPTSGESYPTSGAGISPVTAPPAADPRGGQG
jgi:hypothetical protein